MEEVKRVGKVRVYEIAKDVGVPNRELVAKIQSLGIDVKNHMSSIVVDEVQRVKRALEKERQDNLVEKRLTSTVIRRRSKAPAAAPLAPVAAPPVGDDDGDQIPVGVEPAPVADPAEVNVIAPPTAQFEDPAPAGVEPEPPAVAPAATEDPPVAPQQVEPLPEAAPVEPPVAAVAEPAATPVAVEPQPTAEAPAAATAEAAPTAEPAAPAKSASTRPAGSNPAAKEEATPPPRRIAPGWESWQRQQAAKKAAQTQPTADQPISAADALLMLGGAKPKPRVVITDLDGRRPGTRREVRTGKDMFQNRGYKGRNQRKKRVAGNKKTKKTEITIPAQHKRVIRMQDTIAIGEVARQMGVKSSEVLKVLWGMGMTRVNINQVVDQDTASLLAAEFSYEIEDVAFKEEAVIIAEEDRPEDMQPRPPVVTVMGHVDHGKTSLLDAIRDTDVAEGEAGGITQAIGASYVKTAHGDVVFLDTPGHEAFTAMRARGANCTDLVVLVVAANDGVMPQTVEAIDHAKSAEVPIIVAVNKIDLPNANLDRVLSEIADRGLVPESWGGDTQIVNVSAKTKEGLDTLVEAISLQAEVNEYKANPSKPARGTIIESRLDKAKGAMTSLLVQEGTLRVGDTVVVGEILGKVRALLDDKGRQVKEAGPCTPVEVLGLGGVPTAGDVLNAVTDEKAARTLVEHRASQSRAQNMASATAGKTYEEILQAIQSGESKELKVLLKADVHGSSEAVRDALIKLSTEKVSVNVISAAVGGITENDVNLAKAAGALIAGFNVRPAGKAAKLAEKEHVEIRIYDIIYEMLDEVKVMMRGLLPKERKEKFLGRAEVRETFTIPKVGVIAGCGVQDGKITRHSLLRLVRDNIKIYDGKIGSLRRFKEDVKEVLQGYECGIGLEGYNDIKVGDVIEAYEIIEIAPSL